MLLELALMLVGDTVAVPNRGGVQQGENPAPKCLRTVLQAIVEVYMEKLPAIQFEVRCNTRRKGIKQGASPELAVKMSANFLSCYSSVCMHINSQ